MSFYSTYFSGHNNVLFSKNNKSKKQFRFMVSKAFPDEYVFVKPFSICTAYIRLSNDIGLSRSSPTETTSKLVFKRVARFISSAIAIPLLTPTSVFYNACSFTIKGSLAILTNILGTKLFNYHHNQYINDMNLHIAYAIRDLANNFFIGFISLAMTFEPELAMRIDNFINSSIEKLCISDIWDEVESK